MHPYIHFVVQPIPYSRSLLYPLLLKNTAFLQWYQTLVTFDEVYRHAHRSPLLTYNYSYRYQTQPEMHYLHKYPAVDNITCNLSVVHNKRAYVESIHHKIQFVPTSGVQNWISPIGLDYVVHTEHVLNLDGKPIHYDEIDKELIDKLHL